MNKRPNQIKADAAVTGEEVIHASESLTDNESVSLTVQQIADLGSSAGFTGTRTLNSELYTWTNGILISITGA